MINDQIRIPINGVRQYISIRSEQERAPLLLYWSIKSKNCIIVDAML